MSLLLHVALPLATTVVAVLNLFIDPRKPSDRNKLRIVLGLLAAGFLGQVYLDINKEHGDAEQAYKIMTGVTNTERGVKEILKDLQTAQALQANGYSPEQVASAAQGSAASSQGIPFGQALQISSEANSAIQRIASRLSSSERERVSIEYFPKDVDGAIVGQALTQLGFQLSTVRAKLPEVSTNAVWAGQPVPLDDAKLVALVLVRAGVGIKFIGRIEVPANKKRNLIQVGGTTLHSHLPALTVSQIEALSDYMPQ